MIRLLPVIFIISILTNLVTAAPVTVDQYLLRPGDTLNVNVWNHEDFSDPETQIRPDGKLMLPFVGEIQAAGLTPEQLKTQIQSRLTKELKSPIVTVSVVSFKQEFIFVAGAVVKPGAIAIVDPLTIQQAIATAGGLIPTADINHATIITADGIRSEIDLNSELSLAQGATRTKLLPNSTLFIPEAMRSIAILGAVNQPGAFALPGSGMRVSDAIALAGGFSLDADLDNARLTRTGSPASTFDAQAVVNDVNHFANIQLQVGDVVFIPSASSKTYVVLGEVVKPGINPLSKDRPTRITDALAAAGGITQLANVHTAKLMRVDKEPLTLDLDQLLKGETANDIEINAGDSLYIPRMAFFTIIGQVTKPGRYPLPTDTSVIDAIAAAEGLMGIPSGVSGYIIRQDSSTVDVNLTALLDKKDLSYNLPMHDGDTLVVNGLSMGVVVVGAVRYPGRIIARSGSRFADIIALCGDFRENADSEQCRILRKDVPNIEVNGKLAMRDHRPEVNPLVLDGDTIIVEFSIIPVTVLGDVITPGLYELRKGARITDVIARAAGLRGDSRRGSIYHFDGTMTEFDLQVALKGNNPTTNLELKENDTLFIHSFSAGTATILGNTVKQGSYLINENTRLSELIGLAEGLQENMSPMQATVASRTGEVRIVDVSYVLQQPESNLNIKIADGDIVTVEAPKPVLVVGAVRNAGVVNYHTGMMLSGALASVGGLTADIDPGPATLLRLDGTRLEANLPALLKGIGAEDIKLLPGDVVIVSEIKPIRVSVMGEVKRPGVLSLPAGQRVSSAIAETEGSLPNADMRKIKLVRNNEQRLLDFTPYLRSEELPEDPILEDGDLIVVPNLNLRATVLGMVAKPGIFDIQPDETVISLLGQANGASEQGALNRVILIRQINEKEATYAELDLSKALNTADITKINIKLQNGDILYVPEKSRRNLMQFFRDLLPLTSFIRVFQ